MRLAPRYFPFPGFVTGHVSLQHSFAALGAVVQSVSVHWDAVTFVLVIHQRQHIKHVKRMAAIGDIARTMVYFTLVGLIFAAILAVSNERRRVKNNQTALQDIRPPLANDKDAMKHLTDLLFHVPRPNYRAFRVLVDSLSAVAKLGKPSVPHTQHALRALDGFAWASGAWQVFPRQKRMDAEAALRQCAYRLGECQNAVQNGREAPKAEGPSILQLK